MVTAGATCEVGTNSNQGYCGCIGSYWVDDIWGTTEGEETNLADVGWEGEWLGRGKRQRCANVTRQEDACALAQEPEQNERREERLRWKVSGVGGARSCKALQAFVRFWFHQICGFMMGGRGGLHQRSDTIPLVFAWDHSDCSAEQEWSSKQGELWERYYSNSNLSWTRLRIKWKRWGWWERWDSECAFWVVLTIKLWARCERRHVSRWMKKCWYRGKRNNLFE